MPFRSRLASLFILAFSAFIPVTHAATPPPVITPFLSWPFSEADKSKLTITEGWQYSAEEQAIHGYATHYAVDFAAPRGTPVYAAAAGYALTSFHIAYAGTHEGKTVGFGLGRFVQIWNPQRQVYVQYSHLDRVGAGIPFVAPVKGKTSGGMVTYDPAIVYQPLTEVIKKSKFVRKGQFIGYVGDTGLSWGYQEHLANRDPAAFPSWDETHMHMEIYRRDGNGRKSERYDSFGLYTDASAYQSFTPAVNGLWLKDQEGRVRWTKR